MQAAPAFDALDLTPQQVAARFRAARAAGRPKWLWPEVDVEAWRNSLGAIERACAARLAGSVSHRLEAAHGARALGVAAYTSGTGPLLGYWIEEGWLEADPASAALLSLHLAHARQRAARLGGSLRRALDALAGAGLRAVVLKGSQTGPRYFAEPALRPGSDIDLLVRPGELAAAERALGGAGYELRQRQPRLRRSEWLAPEAPRAIRSLELVHAEDPYTLDLHGTLDRQFLGLAAVRLTTGRHPATVPWPELHPAADVLNEPLATAFLALHASESLHSHTLLRAVELVLVIRAGIAEGRLELERLQRLLEEADALRFAYPALELAERLAPGTLDAGLRAALGAAAPRALRRRLNALRPADVQLLDRFDLGERFMWTKSAGERLRLVAHVFRPAWTGDSRRRLAAAYLDRISQLLRGRVRWRGDRRERG